MVAKGDNKTPLLGQRVGGVLPGIYILLNYTNLNNIYKRYPRYLRILLDKRIYWIIEIYLEYG